MSNREYSHLSVTREGALALLTLQRPEAANAYSSEMLHGIVSALEDCEQDASLRVLIVTGEGPAFCAGGDLKAMASQTGMFSGSPHELVQRYEAGLHRLALAFERFSKPVIAAMNGHAMGGGLTLACMCDLRVCSKEARLGSTFVKVGLVPADGTTFLLPRTVGFPRALDLMLTGRIVNAEEALRIGLVDELVEPDQVLRAALAKGRAIAACSPVAVQLTKKACYSAARLTLSSSMELAAGYQAIAQRSEEHFEAVKTTMRRH